MSLKSTISRIKTLIITVTFLLCCSIVTYSQDEIKVATITGDGATAVTVELPSKKRGIAKKNTTFPSGSTFIVPNNKTVKLETKGQNGNKQTLLQNTRHKIIIDGAWEEHETTGLPGAKSYHDINVNNNKYTISGNGYKTGSQTTKFSVQIEHGGVEVESQEGNIHIYQKVPISINGSSRLKTKVAKKSLTTTKKGFVPSKGKIFISNNPVSEDFTSFQDALDEISTNLENNKSNSSFGYDEMVADDNALIAEIYLELGYEKNDNSYFENAIEFSMEALNYYKYREFYEQDEADMYLNIAEASMNLGDIEEMKYYARLANEILLDIIYNDEIDLYYASLDGDQKLVQEINEDLHYTKSNLNWAESVMD